MLSAEVARAVPFYERPRPWRRSAARAIRWQDREAAGSLPAEDASDQALEDPPSLSEGMRVGAAASLWTGRETEHAASLRFLAPGPRAELSPDDARRLELSPGDEVVVSVNGDSVRAVAAVRSAIQPGSVFITPAGAA